MIPKRTPLDRLPDYRRFIFQVYTVTQNRRSLKTEGGLENVGCHPASDIKPQGSRGQTQRALMTEGEEQKQGRGKVQRGRAGGRRCGSVVSQMPKARPKRDWGQEWMGDTHPTKDRGLPALSREHFTSHWEWVCLCEREGHGSPWQKRHWQPSH